jgi:hypothetical protein
MKRSTRDIERYQDGMDMTELKLIVVISHYNFNYYIGLDNDLLFAKSNDDNETDWYLLLGTHSHFMGTSFCDQGDILVRHKHP